MNKLRLRLDDLTVEGFSTTPAANARGTVHGEQGTWYTYCTCNMPSCDPTCAYTCDDATCPVCPTCEHTCEQTCWETCDDFSCVETCGFSNCETRCGAAATCRCQQYP